MYYLRAEANFDAAHFLHGYIGKCANLHGHRWRIIAELSGSALQTVGEQAGMLLDFGDLKKALRALAEELDHCLIVEAGTLRPRTVDALEEEGFRMVCLPFRPTAEQFAKYLFDEMGKRGFALHRMTVYETPDNCAIYEGDAG